MSVQSQASGPPEFLQTVDLLRNTKALEPLSYETLTLLEEIERLDVQKFSEADVREEVIAPIVRALGYKKQTDFSVFREKHLKVADDDLFADYSFTLWEEHFWVIEAKRVKRKKKVFIGAEVKQALVYAAHPAIDAPLFALCDGRIFHVYDREVSLSEPVIKVEIKKLRREFDKLRALLSPWQNWFFQKRRVIRLVDRVFNREFNLERLSEFRSLIDGRLAGKRSVVVKNYQSLELDLTARENLLRSLPSADLVDLHFFLGQTEGTIRAISETLVQRCTPSSFEVMHRIFEDLPRDTNANYWFNALNFLLTLESSGIAVNWLPQYLNMSNSSLSASGALEHLIALCVTSFKADAARRTVLLFAAAARRRAKQLLIMIPDASAVAEQQHALLRHVLPEFDFAQFASSPASQLGLFLDQMELRQTQLLVESCTDDRGHFSLQQAQQKLVDLWASERAMLGDGKRYRAARSARKIQDSPLSEAIAVGYDQLGHMALVALERVPKWKDYALKHHLREIQVLASYGSWQAKGWLGLAVDAVVRRPTRTEVAERFFMGDEPLLKALADGYGIAI